LPGLFLAGFLVLEGTAEAVAVFVGSAFSLFFSSSALGGAEEEEEDDEAAGIEAGMDLDSDFAALCSGCLSAGAPMLEVVGCALEEAVLGFLLLAFLDLLVEPV
jgi:hypothetical protein